MWIVRAGENAFLIEDFKQLNCVAIGWEVGDLSGKTLEIKEIMKGKLKLLKPMGNIAVDYLYR